MNNASDDDFIGTINSVYGSNANTKYRMYARWKRKIFSKCLLPLYGILSRPPPAPPPPLPPPPAPYRCAFEMLLHSSLNCVRAPRYATWSSRNSSSWSSCLNSWREHIFFSLLVWCDFFFSFTHKESNRKKLNEFFSRKIFKITLKIYKSTSAQQNNGNASSEWSKCDVIRSVVGWVWVCERVTTNQCVCVCCIAIKRRCFDD